MKKQIFDLKQTIEDGSTEYLYFECSDFIKKITDSVNMSKIIPGYKAFEESEEKTFSDTYSVNNVLSICESIKDYEKERMLVIILDQFYRPIYSKEIKNGNEDEVYVNQIDIMQYVISKMGNKFVLCHNHYDGVALPSYPDEHLTETVLAFSKQYNCELVDHIIINKKNEYFSYAETNFSFNWSEDIHKELHDIGIDLDIDYIRKNRELVYEKINIALDSVGGKNDKRRN